MGRRIGAGVETVVVVAVVVVASHVDAVVVPWSPTLVASLLRSVDGAVQSHVAAAETNRHIVGRCRIVAKRSDIGE